MHAQILKNMLAIDNRKVHKLDSTKQEEHKTEWVVNGV